MKNSFENNKSPCGGFQQTWFGKSDPVVSDIDRRVADVLRIPDDKCAEETQVVNYQVDQLYEAHYDVRAVILSVNCTLPIFANELSHRHLRSTFLPIAFRKPRSTRKAAIGFPLCFTT